MNDCTFSAEAPNVIRDENGVPEEWVIFRVGDTPYCQEGQDGVITLTAEDMKKIMAHYMKKGELIPVDSEHFLYELANRKHLDEGEAVKLFPTGSAALGFGSLAFDGEALRIRVNWHPLAYEMLKERIYKYFSPVLRGLADGKLRLTSVALTNTPAINNLDALAARSENNSLSDKFDKTRKGISMGKLEKALMRLTGRDAIALEAEADAESVAEEVEAKASLIEQVADLLGLEKSATVDEIVAALRAETEKAKSADEKQSQLDELAAAAERRAHDDLVARGRAEGRITDADMEYVSSLDSKALSAHLAHCAVKIPGPVRVPARRADAVVLTAEDRAACRRLRIKEEDFLKAKKERTL